MSAPREKPEDRPSAPRTRTRWLRVLPDVLKTLAVLFGGACLGIWLSTTVAAELDEQVFRTVLVLAPALGVTVVVLYVVVKRVVSAWLSPTNVLEVTRSWLGDFSDWLTTLRFGRELEKESGGQPRETREEYRKRLLETLGDVARLFAASLFVRKMLLGSSVLLGSLIAAATLMTAYMQVRRLGEQNDLLDLQADVTLADHVFRSDIQRADLAYREIRDALNDPDASYEDQVHSLSLIPDAMRMAVRHIERAPPGGLARGDEEEHGIDTVLLYEFPNHLPLKSLLVSFLSRDRVAHAIRVDGSPNLSQETSRWTELQRALRPLGVVSDEIVHTLHRLGAEPGSPSLWDWDGRPARPLDAPDVEDRNPAPLPRALPVREGPGPLDFDLAHVKPEELRGIQIPMLFVNAHAEETSSHVSGSNPRVVFPDGADLSRAALQGSLLQGAVLRDANLTEARARGVLLFQAKLPGLSAPLADLRGANLSLADLSAANLGATRMHGAALGKADLRGTEIEGVRLDGAFLDEALLCCASLKNVTLAGASLAGADLTNATLSESLLEGATFDRAHLMGASITDSSLMQATFRGTSLAGARFHSVDVAGADFSEAEFGTSTRDYIPFQVARAWRTGRVRFSRTLAGLCLASPSGVPSGTTSMTLSSPPPLFSRLRFNPQPLFAPEGECALFLEEVLHVRRRVAYSQMARPVELLSSGSSSCWLLISVNPEPELWPESWPQDGGLQVGDTLLDRPVVFSGDQWTPWVLGPDPDESRMGAWSQWSETLLRCREERSQPMVDSR